MKAIKVASVILASVAVGCGGSTSNAPKAKEYAVRGKVTAVEAASKSITIDHEDIPGLMKAMVMKFKLGSEKDAEGIKVGDRVEGKMTVDSGTYTVHGLKRTATEAGR